MRNERKLDGNLTTSKPLWNENEKRETAFKTAFKTVFKCGI